MVLAMQFIYQCSESLQRWQGDWEGRAAQGGGFKVIIGGRRKTTKKSHVTKRGGKGSAGTSDDWGRFQCYTGSTKVPALVFFLSTFIRVRSWGLPHISIGQILRKQFEDSCKTFAFSSYHQCFSFSHCGQGRRAPSWDNQQCGHLVYSGETVARHEDFFHPHSLGCSR